MLYTGTRNMHLVAQRQARRHSLSEKTSLALEQLYELAQSEEAAEGGQARL